VFTHSWRVFLFSASCSCGLEYTHYIIVSDLKLCEVSIYESELSKISDHFLANKAFFHFARCSFTSVDSITYGCNILRPDATWFIRSAFTSFKNLNFLDHHHIITSDTRTKRGFVMLELMKSSLFLTPNYFMTT